MVKHFDSGLDFYLKEIAATPLLQLNEERQLFEDVKAGDDAARKIAATPSLEAGEKETLLVSVKAGDAARDHLVRANLRLVVSVASHFNYPHATFADLVGEGNIGLMHAVGKYDSAFGTRFSTYATYWIKNAIRRMGGIAQTIQIPSYTQKLIVAWHKATLQLQESLGRDPTDDETAALCRFGPRHVATVKKSLAAMSPASLSFESSASGQSLYDCLPARTEIEPDNDADEIKLLRSFVAEMLDRLNDDRSAEVLRMRFGIGGRKRLTLVEIGQRLGISKERVRQIQKQAMKELRYYCSAASA